MPKTRLPEGIRELFTPGEVALILRVKPRTVTNWARTGVIPPEAISWTYGGHRRYDGPTIRRMAGGNRNAS
jgi:DNA-binding transcriptional MerR regulator